MHCCLPAYEMIDPETYPTIQEIFDITKFQVIIKLEELVL